MRVVLILLVPFLIAGCVDRFASPVVPAALEVGRAYPVLVATTREQEADGSYRFARSEDLDLLDVTVSIPPGHQPGELAMSYGRPDPRRQFTLARRAPIPSVDALRQRLAQEQRRAGWPAREVVLFVHGYNAAQTETVFRATQVADDIGLPGSLMVYSWPSRAQPFAYAYDLDSMLFARDGLERTIRMLRQAGAQRVILVAHSMGAALAMETLRQADMRDPGWADRNLESVILISPDLDLDVFRSQMTQLSPVPQPFAVIVSEKDRVLDLSARLRGRAESVRLGNIDSVDAVADLPIDVIDTTAFSEDAASSHFVVATSPSLLTILRSAGVMTRTFTPDPVLLESLAPPALQSSGPAREFRLSGRPQAPRGERR
ncbi:Esterase/lipase superfamily enzyme [Cribrihabitans marinus]|uniref:Esterase/lipase superfamily enzyme n=1 Tax=Cribrihabitans marinus TaxID=1227549 RepID=A0A1H6YTD3_9RHOB|nr:alpha/beta fold hydrolase [Cribrihabitans marinus]GGH29218.1 hypothetical protein GCM10010973_18610 [Cribrihabitans marinus]SEJ40532.1 Esterase/lipase superfamily enzyme [Cribrihabitans marinus]